MTITIEQLEAKHSELADLIAKFRAQQAMKLHPCPLCGESKGYVLRDGDTFSEWIVACAGCREMVSDCASDRRPHIGSLLPASWPAADEAWNAAAAHAQGLRKRIAELEAQSVQNVSDEMVSRFLAWPLPKDFYPDCGISFDGRKDDEWNKNKTWPTGTNLLTAEQARAMLRHVIGIGQIEGVKP